MSEAAPSILGERCSYCGACISVCPVRSLEPGDSYPILIPEKCTNCKLCNRVCPIVNANTFTGEYNTLEMYTARTTLPEVAKVSQDGGVVTTILLAMLESGVINGAVTCSLSPDTPLKPIPIVARSKSQVIGSAGSKYSSSPNLAMLKELGKNDLVAVVGLPCQIRAIHLMERIKLRKFTNPIQFKIGLFCMENYTYDTYVNKILRGTLGVNPQNVIKANIKEGKFMVILEGNEKKSIPVSKLKEFVRASCKICPDLTAEYADISVGSIGSDYGWSTVFIRTGKGKEILDKVVRKGYLEVKALPEDSLKLIKKLARIKRKRAAKQRKSNCKAT